MIKEIDDYLYIPQNAYYFSNGEMKAQSVHYGAYTRYNIAKKQVGRPPVKPEVIAELVKEYLENVGIKTTSNPFTKLEEINYEKIKEKYQLESCSDLVWMKFTTDGYLGVVATSDDINYSQPEKEDQYDEKITVYNKYKHRYEEQWRFNTAGILTHKLKKRWDTTFVLVFPLHGIPFGYDRSKIEHAVGNFLLEKGVPIIDVLSHVY